MWKAKQGRTFRLIIAVGIGLGAILPVGCGQVGSPGKAMVTNKGLPPMPTTRYLSAAAISPDGLSVLTGYGWDHPKDHASAITLWDVPTGRIKHLLSGHRGAVVFLAFLPDGKSAVSAGADGTVRVWDLNAGVESRCLTCFGECLMVAALTPDGKWLVLAGAEPATPPVAGARMRLQLWDLPEGKLVRSYDQPVDGIQSLDVTPNAEYAIANCYAGDQLMIKMIDLRTGSIVLGFKDLSDGVFSPDAKVAVSEKWEPTKKDDVWPALRFPAHLVVWDVATGKVVRHFQARKSATRCFNNSNKLAFSGDGKQVVSADGDGMLRFWDVATGRECLPALVMPRGSGVFVFSPDRRLGLVGRGQGNQKVENTGMGLSVWDLKKGRRVSTLVQGWGP